MDESHRNLKRRSSLFENKRKRNNSTENYVCNKKLIKVCSSDTEERILCDLPNLKARLKYKDNVESFIEKNQEELYNIILLCQKISLETLTPGNIARIFESTSKAIPAIKVALLRLIGGIVKHGTTIDILLSNRLLLDRIAYEVCSDTEDVSKLAISIFSLISRRVDGAKAIILSNGCYSTGILISKKRTVDEILNRTDVFNLLCRLTKLSPCRTAAQLSNNNEKCMENIILLISTKHHEKSTALFKWKKLILKWTRQSRDLRENLGKRAIEYILSTGEFCNYQYQFASYFMKEPFGRSYLCETGVFDKVVSMFSNYSDDQQSIFQSKLVEGLNHIIYDKNECLARICSHPTFLSASVVRIRRYLLKFAFTCKVEYAEPRDLEETLVYNSEHNSSKINIENSEVVYSDEASSSSKSPMFSPMSSPNDSFSRSPYITSTSNTSLSPASSCSFLENFFAQSESSEDDDSSEKHKSNDNEMYSSDSDYSSNIVANELVNDALKQIAFCCVTILSQISHMDEEFSICLVKKDILQALIDYIANSEIFDNKLSRSLIRLAKNQLGIKLLVEVDMHRMILNKLIRNCCQLARRSEGVCHRCLTCRKFGRELLSTLADQVDSPIGWYLLSSALISANIDQNSLIRTMTSALILIRNRNKSRLYQQFNPIETLLEILKLLITDFDAHRESSRGEEIADQCWEIISSLSTLVHKKGLCTKFGPDEIIRLSTKIPLSVNKNDDELACKLTSQIFLNTIKFYNKQGALIAEISKEQLCETSKYFERMFQNKFVEAVEDQKDFIFDEDLEKCSQDEFVRFIHLSSGCSPGNECVKFDSAETFSSILFLADKYLCTELLDTLFKKECLIHARSMVCGDSLRFFLSICFNVPHIAQYFQSICILVLLCYTNYEQMKETVGYISSIGAVQMVIEMISEFIFPFTDNSNHGEQVTSFMDF